MNPETRMEAGLDPAKSKALRTLRRIVRRARARLWDASLRYLTAPILRSGPAAAESAELLAGVLRRGDVLLSEGTTRVSILIKRLTGSPWSHVSMYVGPLDDGHDPRCIVEADIAAGVRSIRLSELDALNVRVLRPSSLDGPNRNRLVEWVTSRIGSEYDHAHALQLGRRLLRLPLRTRARPSSSAATRFICCSLLAHAFASVGLAIAPVRPCGDAGTCADPASITPADFEQAPVFEVVVEASPT
jgi:hypothetical protein